MGEIIRVGMADLNLTEAPNVLVTLGLGSCVGVIIYDPIKKVAGMLHAMLPYAGEMRDNANKAKFADTGVVETIERLKYMGAFQSRLVAKVAGGAQMFAFSQCSDVLKIGQRNVTAAKEVLDKYRIPVIAEDTGGSFGRTIEFYTETGVLLIKTVGLGVKEI